MLQFLYFFTVDHIFPSCYLVLFLMSDSCQTCIIIMPSLLQFNTCSTHVVPFMTLHMFNTCFPHLLCMYIFYLFKPVDIVMYFSLLLTNTLHLRLWNSTKNTSTNQELNCCLSNTLCISEGITLVIHLYI